MTGMLRRSLLRGFAAAPAMVLAPGMLGLDTTRAEGPGGMLRVGMTVAAVPAANGCPDQGGEGLRFMGITLFDQLVAWDLTRADRPAGLIPALATAWRVDPENPRRWHFALRENVRFHDGRVMTADDIVFSFDRAFRHDAAWFDQRANSQIVPQVPNISAWGSEGPLAFWVETGTPDGTLPYAMTWLGIVSRAGWEAAGRDWTVFQQKAIGTGPWKMQEFTPRERCLMTRNADYWDTARIPRAERLMLLPIPDPNTRVAALRSGQVDFIEAPAPDSAASLRAAGFRIVTNVYPHNWTWFFARIPGSPWNDIRVRKAANLGIDRSALKTLLDDLMLEGQGLVTKGSPWYGSPHFALVHDPDTARKLMAEAGYGPGNRLRTKVAISSSGSGQMQPLAMNEALQQNLAEIGIDVDFEVFEWQALIEAWKAGAGAAPSRGCMALNISQSTADPFRTFARILQSNLAPPNGVNWGRFSYPDLDKLFAATIATSDVAEQNRILGETHTKVVDEALFLFAAHDLNPRALSPKVHGFVQAQSWNQDLTPISLS